MLRIACVALNACHYMTRIVCVAYNLQVTISFISLHLWLLQKEGNKAQGRSVNLLERICMTKRLFVGSLAYQVTQSELEKLFTDVGVVESANLITDKFSGGSKGFGFVEMSTDEDAKKAIEQLNGKEVAGRNIVVNEARPREERQGGFNRAGFDNKRPRRRY